MLYRLAELYDCSVPDLLGEPPERVVVTWRELPAAAQEVITEIDRPLADVERLIVEIAAKKWDAEKQADRQAWRELLSAISESPTWRAIHLLVQFVVELDAQPGVASAVESVAKIGINAAVNTTRKDIEELVEGRRGR